MGYIFAAIGGACVLAFQNNNPDYLNLTVLLGILHIIGGVVGGKVYYWRHGHFPGEKPGTKKVTFRQWLGRSWKYLLLILAAGIVVCMLTWQGGQAGKTITFLFWPLILLPLLIGAADLVNWPAKKARPAKDAKEESNTWKFRLGSTAHIWIPAALTLFAGGFFSCKTQLGQT